MHDAPISISAASADEVDGRGFLKVGVEFTDPFGMAAIILSWFTNIWATAAISFKAWYVCVRHRVKVYGLLTGQETSPNYQDSS